MIKSKIGFSMSLRGSQGSVRILRSIAFAILIMTTCIIDSTGSDIKINSNIAAKLDYYQAKIDNKNETFNNMLPFYDTIIEIYDIQRDFKNKVKFMVKKADFANNNGNRVKAFYIYREVLSEYEKHGDSLKMYEDKKKCMYSIARCALDLGMFDESTAYAIDLLKYTEGKDLNYVARGYAILGFVFVNLNKVKEAEEYNNKALEIIRTTDTISPETSYSVYNNYAGLLFTKQKPDSAIKYLTEAKKFTKYIDDESVYCNIYHNFAIVYESIGENSVAKEYFIKTLELVKYNEYLHITALTYNNLASLYYKMDEKSEALDCYNKALAIATKIGATAIRGDALIAISDLYYEKGDYKRSRDLLEEGRKVRDSVFNTQNVDRISVLTDDFERQNERMESALLKQTLEISRLRRNIMIGIIVIIAIIVIIISIKLIRQNRLNKILNSTVSVLRQKNKKYEERSKYKFESIIDVKNKELTSTSLALVTVNEVLDNVKRLILELKDSPNEFQKRHIFQQIDAILKSYNPEHYKKDFMLYFEQVKQSFFTNLNEAHPNLTYEEQQICALIILNLSAKEIANLTNKSIRTIETKIYQIRKSMNIPTREKTITYLRQFVVE